MKKNLDELKKEAVATFVNPNAGRRKIPTFNDATEAIEHYKSKSNDLSLCKRQRQRYQKIFNFAAQPGRTLMEIYEKIEDERKQERLSVKQRREKKEEKRNQSSPDSNLNDNGLGTSTEQASNKKKKAEPVNFEELGSKEEIKVALEKRKENLSESSKTSLQALINMVNRPETTLTDVRTRLLYSKQRHSEASQSSKKRLRLRKKKSEPSGGTAAPMQTGSKPQSSNPPTSPRPQTPVTRTSPKSRSPNMGTSPNSPNPIAQGTPKSQPPKSEERRYSNESFSQHLCLDVDEETDWISSRFLD